MSVPLVINGVTFNYPAQGELADWSVDASAWAQAVTALLGTISGASDINTTLFSLNNNVAVATNIQGLFFDPSVVKGALVSYAIFRSTNLSTVSEFGLLLITKTTTSPFFEMARFAVGGVGDVGVPLSFSLSTSGQIQYTSSNLAGTGYSGTIFFKATAFRT